MFSLTQI